MNHPTEEQLILHYYGDGGQDDWEPHLAECTECREIYQRLQRVLNSLVAAPMPQRGADDGQKIWHNVQASTAPRRWLSWERFGLERPLNERSQSPSPMTRGRDSYK